LKGFLNRQALGVDVQVNSILKHARNGVSFLPNSSTVQYLFRNAETTRMIWYAYGLKCQKAGVICQLKARLIYKLTAVVLIAALQMRTRYLGE
jgi:hypothetical protein